MKQHKNSAPKNNLNASSSATSTSQSKSIQLLKENTVIQLQCNIKPGAKESRISDLNSDEIGIQIAAPPMDGEANEELIKFLSKLFNVRKSNVTIKLGSKSRSKIIQIEMENAIKDREQVENILKVE